MSPGVEIRREVRPSDLDEIVDMHARLYPAEYGLSPNMEHHVAAAIDAAVQGGWPESGAAWIVERDGWFTGSLALTDEGEGNAALRWFLFDPAVRGHGLGRRLVGELVAEAEAMDFQRIWLETLGILTVAGRIYRDHGFRVIDERLGPPWGDSDIHYQRYELLLRRGRTRRDDRALAGLG